MKKKNGELRYVSKTWIVGPVFHPRCAVVQSITAHVFFTIAGKSGWPPKNAVAFTLVTAYASIKLFFAN